MARNGTVSATHRRAIDALMTSRSVAAAADASGVSLRTLWRWLSEPLFVAELRGATASTIEQTARRLASLSGKAVDVLEDTLSGDDPLELSSMRQLRAADMTLKHLAGLRDLADIELRLKALEDAQQPTP